MSRTLTFVGGILGLVFSVGTVIRLGFQQGEVDDFMLLFFVVLGGSAIILGDFSSSLLSTDRRWSAFVLLTDLLLLCQAREGICRGVISVCILYLCVAASESSLRYGIYDVEWSGYEQHKRQEKYECSNLPCPVPLPQAFLTLAFQLFVFLLDYSCTRGFARRMEEEQKCVLASIQTVNEIATSLSKFDLISAGKLLDDATIPVDLKTAFIALLGNLHTYQPYLPQSCLPRDSDSSSVTAYRSSLMSFSDDKSTSSSPSVPQFTLRKGFFHVNASLLVVNINNSMSVLNCSLSAFEKLISALVGSTFNHVMLCKGTPDLFLGDRMYANFGASRQRIPHIYCCLECSTKVLVESSQVLYPFQEASEQTLSINVAVATGRLACGDLGSESMLRFSLIGKLSQWVAAIERLGSKFEIPLLANEAFHNEVAYTTESRVILQSVIFKGELELIFEVSPAKSADEEEWMYQMAENGVGRWDSFNSAAIAVLKGTSIPEYSFTAVPHQDNVLYEKLKYIIRNGPPLPLPINS